MRVPCARPAEDDTVRAGIVVRHDRRSRRVFREESSENDGAEMSEEREPRRMWAVGRVDRRSTDVSLADAEEAPIEGPFRMKAVVRSSEPGEKDRP